MLKRSESSEKVSRRQFLKHSARLGVTLGGVGLASALAGCAAPPPAQPGTAPSQPGTAAVELSFWKPPHGPDADLFKPILDEFAAQNPSYQVNHKVIPWGSVDEQFTAAFAGGNPPDVFYLPDEWYPKYVKQAQIADLSSIAAEFEANYDQNVWVIGAFRGKQYGIPFLGVIHAILLNMTLFESFGLTVPETWDDIRAAAKALTDASKGTYGIQLSTWQTFTVPLLVAGGTQVLSEDLTRVTANTPGGVAAFETVFQEIGKNDQSAVPLGFTDDQANALALEGKVGIMWREQSGIKNIWRKQQPDIKLDVIPMPKVEGTEGKPAVWTNVGFLFVAEGSKRKEDAFKLLRFLSSKSVQEEYVVKGVDLMSPMKGVVPQDVDPVVAKFLSYLPIGSGTQVSVNWREASVALKQEAEAIWSGQKTAKQALADFEAMINPILDGS